MQSLHHPSRKVALKLLLHNKTIILVILLKNGERLGVLLSFEKRMVKSSFGDVKQ